ncbi:hypothetical protein HPP92_004573 [Vanilla planifolia]|uniref:DUF632 domain-containing protein n=1 Tax=Vanilla planifolia TaxID=51239 RepID=A0A835RL92_VANPL|nr:hypothetical protein HPP92_004573 [Vanilla planifolia]
MAGSTVSVILEAPGYGSSFIHGVSGKKSNYCKSFNPLLWSWSSNPKASSFSSFRNYKVESNKTSHSCTVEKLYAWEKKLYIEVKSCEKAKEEKDRRLSLLRRQEAKGIDYFKIQKNKREIERLESKLVVSCQAIEATSSEIVRLRDSELFPQLLELVNGLVSMWSVMYECHHFQTQIIRQLEHIKRPSSTVPTSSLLRQATQQLEDEVGYWYSAFCNLLKSQRDYVNAVAGWLRLSLFHCEHTKLERNRPNSEIYNLCEEWQLALDKLPHKVASDGIKSLLTMIHAVVVQQTDEQRQQKRLNDTSKQLKRRSKELRSLQCRYGPYSAEGTGDSAGRAPVMEKKAEVDALRKRVEEEKNKYEKSSGSTRVMTMNNLQTGFPSVFEAMAGFSCVCMQAFGSVCGHQKSSGLALDFNRILG